MIIQMNKRVAGVVALLGLALTSVSHSAFAQDGNSWFDDGTANDQPPGPPPATQPATESSPAPAAPPLQSSPPSAPGPQAPAQEDNVPETDPRAITEFRPTLDPYGTWV